MGINSYIPPTLKHFIRLKIRHTKDVLNATRFATAISNVNGLNEITSIIQPITKNSSTANKIHNLGIAVEQLNNIEIGPNKTFSFWKVLGNPSKKNGYKESRTIINGALTSSVGGGLCQLSGLIYYLALQAGLTITERHAHSIDIYNDDERYTPLGSDATVSYGYKDLRFVNPLPFPVTLQLELSGTALTGSLLAHKKAQSYAIEFTCTKYPSFTEVITLRHHNGEQLVLTKDRYRLLSA